MHSSIGHSSAAGTCPCTCIGSEPRKWQCRSRRQFVFLSIVLRARSRCLRKAVFRVVEDSLCCVKTSSIQSTLLYSYFSATCASSFPLVDQIYQTLSDSEKMMLAFDVFIFRWEYTRRHRRGDPKRLRRTAWRGRPSSSTSSRG